MAYSRNTIQSSWASLVRRHRPTPSNRYPESRQGLSPEKTLGFLQLLDLRLEELDRALLTETLSVRHRKLRTERETVQALRLAFLEQLSEPVSED